MTRRAAWFAYAAILGLAVLCIGAGGLALVGSGYNQFYADRVYPGIGVYGIPLGGLTEQEAAATLQVTFPDPAALPLTLRERERTWNRTWADMGLHLDPLATAHLAYQVGREGTPAEQAAERLQALVAGWALSPVIVLPDAARATAALEALAPEAAIPPLNAALVIQPGSIVQVPAQAGRELDIEATVAALPHAINAGGEGLAMTLLTRQVEPAISTPHPALAQAERLLAGPFFLSGVDALTSFSRTWTVEAGTVAQWLVAEPVEDETGARLVLAAQEEPIQAYLTDLDSRLSGETDEVSLNIERSVPTIRAAIEAGEGQAAIFLSHPPRTYVVQPGDTLMSIGRSQGFPAWWLLEANPDIDPETLIPGQQIVIPSIDVLFPLPLITERHILVDISDLRLYAYEGDTLVYDFPCSTGIPTSPTIPGSFQVLSKEENAYASSWDLWMPHFIGIYRSGPDFTNGIHGLPTLSSGAILWGGYLGRQPISYGCIVIGLEEATALYDWVELGTLVVIQE